MSDKLESWLRERRLCMILSFLHPLLAIESVILAPVIVISLRL